MNIYIYTSQEALVTPPYILQIAEEACLRVFEYDLAYPSASFKTAATLRPRQVLITLGEYNSTARV